RAVVHRAGGRQAGRCGEEDGRAAGEREGGVRRRLLSRCPAGSAHLVRRHDRDERPGSAAALAGLGLRRDRTRVFIIFFLPLVESAKGGARVIAGGGVRSLNARPATHDPSVASAFSNFVRKARRRRHLPFAESAKGRKPNKE